VVNWHVNHDKKKFQRQRLFMEVPTVNNYLTLCAGQCLDIVAGMKLGKLNDSTNIHGVESNKDVFRDMRDWFNHNWHGGIRLSCSDLAKVKLDCEYDLVFLDYLGNVCKRDVIWMQSELGNHLTANARVGVTALQSFRGNKFFAELFHTLHKELNPLIKCDGHKWRDEGYGRYPVNMLGYLAVYSVLFRTFVFSSMEYKIRAYYYGENTASMMLFFVLDFNGRRCNPSPDELYAQQVISNILGCVSKQSGEIPMAVTSANEYVDKFLSTPKTYDSMRGLKACLTKFCEKKERETGTPAVRFRAAIKAVITRKGGDSSCL
jgi:hypothetical protein